VNAVGSISAIRGIEVDKRSDMRTAWAKGEKANFYPYGKTHAQVFAEQE
jgi:hypothetical protein